jgi:hypothetical protein
MDLVEDNMLVIPYNSSNVVCTAMQQEFARQPKTTISPFDVLHGSTRSRFLEFIMTYQFLQQKTVTIS